MKDLTVATRSAGRSERRLRSRANARTGLATLAAVAALAGLLSPGSAQAQTLPRVDVAFQEKPLRVDGRLDDAAWTTAVPMPLGTVEGSPITKGPVARMAWDREDLYVAVEIPDPLLIAGRTGRDSAVWERDDVLEVFLWPDETQPYYYQIAVNPRGTFFDGFFVANASRTGAVLSLPDWNPNVRAQARLSPASVYRPDRPGTPTEGGFWTVEMAIPIASLSSRTTGLPAPGETWRAQIVRFNRPDPRPGELDAAAWSPYGNVTEPYLLDRFGTIVFQGGPAPVIPPLVPGTGVSTQPSVTTPPAVTPPSPVTPPAVTPPAEPAAPTTPATPEQPATPDQPTTPPATAEVQRVTVSFREMPLREAMDILFRGTGKQFTLSPAAAQAAPSVTVEVQDLPFDAALSAVLQAASTQNRTELWFNTQNPTGTYVIDARTTSSGALAGATGAVPSTPPSVAPGSGK